MTPNPSPHIAAMIREEDRPGEWGPVFDRMAGELARDRPIRTS